MTTIPNPTGLSIPDSADTTPTQVKHSEVLDANFIQVRVSDKTTQGARSERMVSESDYAVQLEGDILSTLRTKSGGPVMDHPKPDHVVTVRGVAMKVESAVREGYLAIDEHGSLYEVDPAYRAEQIINKQEKARAEELAQRVIVDQENAAVVDHLQQSLAANGLDAAQALSELWMSEPGVLPRTFAQLAQATDTDPAEMTAQLGTLITAYEQALNQKLLAPLNIESGTFWDYVEKNVTKADLARASTRLALRGDASMFESFLQKFTASHGAGKGGPSGAVYRLPEGVTSRVWQGQTLVTITLPSGRKQETTFQNARNLGLV